MPLIVLGVALGLWGAQNCSQSPLGMCRGHQLYVWDNPTEKRTMRTEPAAASSNTRCNANREGCKTGFKQLWILSQSVPSSSSQQWGAQTFLLQKQLHEPEGEPVEPGGGAPKMTLLGPGKTGRF